LNVGEEVPHFVLEILGVDDIAGGECFDFGGVHFQYVKLNSAYYPDKPQESAADFEARLLP
jgi:hypothetical protein